MNYAKVIWDYAGIVEVSINRPARDVWPHFFGEKKEVWAKTHYTAVAGRSGEVGETFSNAYLNGRLIYETIKIQSASHLALKITHQEDTDQETKLIGYDFITLRELSGTTIVTCVQAFAIPVEVSKADLAGESEKQDAMLTSIFGNLKDVVEKGG